MVDKHAQERAELIKKLNIEYSAVFVPQSLSRNANEKDLSLNWKITIKRGRQSVTFDYMQGIGHARIPQPIFCEQVSANMNSIAAQEKMKELVEKGHYHIETTMIKQPQPELNNVLYSLVLDADAINYDSFEGWANEFGYDTDSRKAEKIYQECLQSALKLRNLLGDDNLMRLQELFSDY